MCSCESSHSTKKHSFLRVQNKNVLKGIYIFAGVHILLLKKKGWEHVYTRMKKAATKPQRLMPGLNYCKAPLTNSASFEKKRSSQLRACLSLSARKKTEFLGWLLGRFQLLWVSLSNKPRTTAWHTSVWKDPHELCFPKSTQVALA